MLPLAGSKLPQSHDELREAIKRGLAEYSVSAREISVEGGAFPTVDRLHVDLTDARLSRELRLPEPGAPGPERIHVTKVDVHAAPLFFESAPLTLTLNAADASLALAHTTGGDSLLTLARTAHGEVVIEASRADLQELAHKLIVEAASKQGVDIKRTELEVTSRTPRSVEFRAVVTAKMFVMSATVAVSGDVSIDDDLNARFENLKCAGDGMIASTANAFLRPQFQRLQNRKFPLLAFSIGDARLRDIRIEAGETIRVSAEIGS